jgi:hypothetical protein
MVNMLPASQEDGSMSKIEGSPEELLAVVQEIVDRHAPGAVCELQKYKTQIGCGALDERGILHEVQMGLQGLTDYLVENQARALASRLGPRMTLIRRG